MRLSVICCAFASWAAGENTQNILADTIEAVPLPCIQMWDNELNRLIPQKHCPPPPPPLIKDWPCFQVHDAVTSSPNPNPGLGANPTTLLTPNPRPVTLTLARCGTDPSPSP